jgi:hypothetical protein
VNVQELVLGNITSNPKENLEKKLLENFTSLDVPANPFVMCTIGNYEGDLLATVYSVVSDKSERRLF